MWRIVLKVTGAIVKEELIEFKDWDHVLFIPLKGAIVEQELQGWYILYMTNMYHMYHPLFFMTFYVLGIDNFKTVELYFKSTNTRYFQ